MRRIFLALTAVAVLLALFAPAALAASEPSPSHDVLVSVDGNVEVPPGDRVDGLIVISGDARVRGDVDSILIVDGHAALEGATTQHLWVVDGSVDLGPGTTVTGDVVTLNGTVTRQAGSTVLGSIDAIDGDLTAFAIAMIPLAILFMLGLAVFAVVAALVVATLGARQTRDLEALISREPGPVLVAGVLGAFLVPAAAILLIVTVIGAPVGLALLFLVLPAVLFLAWLVAAIWVGDWLVARMRGSREPERPILAAILGVVVLSVAGMLPFVSAIATVFGFGALLLAAWRTARGEPKLAAPSGAMPVAAAG